MAHGPKRVDMSDDGRIIEVVMDEHVSADSELAVQALPVERKPWGDRGALDRHVFADDPEAVQALPPVRHASLRRLPDDLREEAERRRAEREGEPAVDERDAEPHAHHDDE